jgi:hypothetical protein
MSVLVTMWITMRNQTTSRKRNHDPLKACDSGLLLIVK